jgi:hypothetical protein
VRVASALDRGNSPQAVTAKLTEVSVRAQTEIKRGIRAICGLPLLTLARRPGLGGLA